MKNTEDIPENHGHGNGSNEHCQSSFKQMHMATVKQIDNGDKFVASRTTGKATETDVTDTKMYDYL